MVVLAILWFLGACAGHATWWIVLMNCMYGYALPRPFLRFARRVLETIILSAPLVFGYACWRWLEEPADAAIHLRLLWNYGLFCSIIGYGILPAITLWRLMRPRPAALASNDTRTLDVADQLGQSPAGDGKYRLLTYLPLNQCFQVDFSERTLVLPRLPAAWDGLTILHLSDVHFCGTPDRAFFRYVIDRCQDWPRPDLLALTGDIVDTLWHHRWIVPLMGRLRWNVAGFAILGNHDYWLDPSLVRRRLRRVGLHVIGNSWQQIDVHGLPLVVIGNETPWFAPAPDLTGCPEGVFRLCLSHTPDTMPWARRQGIDLMLAGHNHGGQIRLPLIGSIFVPSRYSRRYDCGVFVEPPTVLHVSRGLAGKHPLRFNCRPEVTRIVLKQSR